MQFIRDKIRMAGDKLREFDDNYSDKIGDMYMGQDSEGDFISQTLAMALGGTSLSAPGSSPGLRNLKISSAAAKYGAPLGATALAIKGAYDLTNMYGSSADQQEPSQLSL